MLTLEQFRQTATRETVTNGARALLVDVDFFEGATALWVYDAYCHIEERPGPTFYLNIERDEWTGERPDLEARLYWDFYVPAIANGVDLLATQFSNVLRGWLSVGELATINTSNAMRGDDGTCATHDFCDANMAMWEAFQTVTGEDMDPASDDHAWLVNEAWALARKRGFRTA